MAFLPIWWYIIYLTAQLFVHASQDMECVQLDLMHLQVEAIVAIAFPQCVTGSDILYSDFTLAKLVYSCLLLLPSTYLNKTE